MGKANKTLLKIMSGDSGANLPFDDILTALRSLSFLHERKAAGSHTCIFQGTSKNGQPIFINIQQANGQAKPYQVKQIRRQLAEMDLPIDKETVTP